MPRTVSNFKRCSPGSESNREDGTNQSNESSPSLQSESVDSVHSLASQHLGLHYAVESDAISSHIPDRHTPEIRAPETLTEEGSISPEEQSELGTFRSNKSQI